MVRAQTDGATQEDQVRPASLQWSLRLLGGLVLFGGVVVVVMVVRHDDLIRAWAQGNPSARLVLQTQGIDALKDVPEGKTQPPAFITPAIVLYVTLTLLFWVLSRFLKNGFELARMAISAMLLVVIICAIGGALTGPPPLFVGATVVGIAIALACGVLMWLPSSSRYIHPNVEARMARLRSEVRSAAGHH